MENESRQYIPFDNLINVVVVFFSSIFDLNFKSHFNVTQVSILAKLYTDGL